MRIYGAQSREDIQLIHDIMVEQAYTPHPNPPVPGADGWGLVVSRLIHPNEHPRIVFRILGSRVVEVELVATSVQPT